MAVAFANVFMAEIEQSIITQSTTKSLVWKRCIDDVCCPWNITKDKIEEFVRRENYYRCFFVLFCFFVLYHSVSYLLNRKHSIIINSVYFSSASYFSQVSQISPSVHSLILTLSLAK